MSRGEHARTFVDVVDDVDVVRVVLGDLGRCLAKARSEIAGFQVVGHDGCAVGFDVRLRIRLADGNFQPFGCKLRFGKRVGSFDRERAHDVARSFRDVKCNLDVSAVIDNGRSDLHAAESLRLVDSLEVVDTGAHQLIAELPCEKKCFF